MDKGDTLVDIHRKAVELIDQGRCCVMAVILKVEGSTPQQAGVRALIDETGKIWGTLGGGLVEAEARRRAVGACKSKRPVVFDLDLDNAYSREAGGICGGHMRILMDPTLSKDRECYARVAESLQRRERGVLLTAVRAGPQTEVTVRWFPEEAIPEEAGFPDAEEIRSCVARESPKLFAVDSLEAAAPMEVLVEPVIPKPILLIVGGGHVGQALACQAAPVGFDVTIIDDRPEFTNPTLFPEGVTTRCGDIPKELAAFPIADDVYVVLVTRGHKQDAEALEACLHAPAAYIGMIGSKRKVAMIRKGFLESGLATEDEFSRVFAPIGLDIGAVTVPEIATSIAAQLVAVRRKGSAHTPPGDMVLR